MQSREESPGRRPPSRSFLLRRAATAAVFAAAGLLMATSAQQSAGTDLRPGRYDDLADLARQEGDRLTGLRSQIQELTDEIATLRTRSGSADLQRVERAGRPQRVAAGLDELQGPGLTVTLDDAPREVLVSAGEDVNNAIVHQQDIQGVANALWAGGAEAMTIQGVRIISTTGIKCVGNTVVLNGVPYSPPYRIAAIGDPELLRGALDRNPYVRAYRQAVDVWQLEWDVEESEELVAPTYAAPVELRHAEPLREG
jgi:uncharacterized protein YlxW (UPF0749 family)